MAKKPNAREKLRREKFPKRVELEKDFAGVKAGSMLFVATPMIVDEYIRQIPEGGVQTVVSMREELARRNTCDATCPVSTAIFVRMVAEAALEEIEEGASAADVAPFWRIIEGKDKISGKLNVDPAWIDHRREVEAQA